MMILQYNKISFKALMATNSKKQKQLSWQPIIGVGFLVTLIIVCICMWIRIGELSRKLDGLAETSIRDSSYLQGTITRYDYKISEQQEMITRLENQLSVLRQLKEKTWKQQDNGVKQMSSSKEFTIKLDQLVKKVEKLEQKVGQNKNIPNHFQQIFENFVSQLISSEGISKHAQNFKIQFKQLLNDAFGKL